ncbi:MAG TPA: ELWxxDGT repeat protein [Myxococcus sp.]|jgi:ELWxxDGT repeat protein|nr:ELWxxDGT repeat protein [Myxococcus sp.]
MRCWLPFCLVVAVLSGCTAEGPAEQGREKEAGGAALAARGWEVCGRTAVSLGSIPSDTVDESRAMAHLGAGLLFAADDGRAGSELWLSSGSQGTGTHLLTDLAPGPSSSAPMEFTRVGDRVFFAAEDPVAGRELFVSDGTAQGTRLVKDLWPGETGSLPRSLFELNGRLYFSAGDPDHGRELWRSDGTAEGTVLVEDLDPGEEGTSPGQLTRGGDGALYFVAQLQGGLFTALMRKDGDAPAVELFRTPSERGISSPLVPMGRRLFFIAGGGHGTPVRLMATAGGRPAVFVADFGEVYALATVGGRLLLSATLDMHAHDAELWVSDGSMRGTRRLKDLRSGMEGSEPGGFTVMGSRLFFTADDGIHGRELWVSDGTEGGTRLVADLRSGAEGSYPEALTPIQGHLFFSAERDGEGQEAWVSDGTAQGTVALDPLAPGLLGSGPRDFQRSGWDVFFTGDDGIRGRGLWALPFRPDGKCAAPRR